MGNEDIMNSESPLSSETIDKLKSLLKGFNTFGNQADMYSLFVKNTLKPKSKI